MAVDTLPMDFGSDKRFYVYLYRDPRKRKRFQPIYVGKGTAKTGRADVHWRHRTHNPILQAILDKIRIAELEPSIEIIGWFDDEEAAFQCECALIAKFGRRNLKEGPLANMTAGGDGHSGMKHSQSSIEKTRAAHIGSKRSAAVIEKMKAAWTPERKADHVARCKARETRDETRQKISAAKAGIKIAADVVERRAAKLRGRKQTEEQKRKSGEGIRKTWTPERRAEQARRMQQMQHLKYHGGAA